MLENARQVLERYVILYPGDDGVACRVEEGDATGFVYTDARVGEGTKVA